MNGPQQIRRRSAIVAALAAFCAAPAMAQTARAYPAKPIRIIVPHPPGDTTDNMARTIGDKLTAAWGQPVVVENKLGAGGMIAADAMAKAAPDGYTLLLTISSLVQNSVLHTKLPYDLFRDFAPVALVATTPLAYIVNASSPYRSVADFIAVAKARPGELSYASYGLGTTAHIYYELLAGASKTRISHVPYKGGAPIMTDVLGGQVDSGLLSLSVALPQHRAGRIRILAISNSKRFASLPDVPTFAEAGYPELSGAGWVGLLAPASTPKDVVDKLSAEFARVLQMPEIGAKFESMAIEAVSSTPAAFGDILQNDYRKWSKVIKDFQIKAE